MIRQILLVATLATSATGFTAPTTRAGATHLAALDNEFNSVAEVESFDPLNLADESSPSNTGRTAIATAAMLMASTPLAASAAGPDWGIFEGRTLSLLHPAMMAGMLAFSVSTGLLGFQWRRQRTMGDEISALKKTLPNLNGAKTVKEALAAAEGAEEVDASYVRSLKAAMPTASQVEELTKERKDLASAGPKDKHFNQGALLVFLGTSFAIEGPLNTYARAGKLFPGPHLYAGAGLVCLWALAASMVPHMQKGNDTARTVHIGANLAGIGLFVWQVTSGIPILFKVLEFTKWP
mmetsp:Transcript_443/g.871  ORF Transcript_443/g.871 Transcript_443/m.871 type:complete len:294 (+) Transcript_443:71-952(+)|eukprot:CAMPEP_0172308888 /NCGR_PEP_ID=MMETSP1058-20130122/9346_1 /TAXON_ID=83371 /ORGANISM="Detonula confervacea, Strain CCMP 353" /LENGTH=293 /DNA_ID=CAMNT_0013021409 /DNA_START=27 /DNA_END=908 /DNA_ORIENTATION=-